MNNFNLFIGGLKRSVRQAAKQQSTPKETDGKKKKKRGEIVGKMVDNVKELLKHSNASLIGPKKGLDYCCLYCDFKNRSPIELKTHFRQTHSSEDLKFKRQVIFDFVVKLDITDLSCNICNTDLYSLEELITHLQTKHKVEMHDVKNQILPFKFTGGPLSCFLCAKEFESFKALLEHANVHYKNFVCESCGAGFVNEMKLTYHCRTHESPGTFPCSHCPKVLDTKKKQYSHEETHVKKYRLKCWQCDERFNNSSSKELHMVKVHGANYKLSRECLSCGKIYPNRVGLRAHLKRVHLRDRRYECTECDMSFASSAELKRHFVKHTGEKNYECQVCKKSFGRHNTLREHMKIHLNDRRFKCEYCGEAFVQKCSWKAHMKNKHGEIAETHVAMAHVHVEIEEKHEEIMY